MEQRAGFIIDNPLLTQDFDAVLLNLKTMPQFSYRKEFLIEFFVMNISTVMLPTPSAKKIKGMKISNSVRCGLKHDHIFISYIIKTFKKEGNIWGLHVSSVE